MNIDDAWDVLLELGFVLSIADDGGAILIDGVGRLSPMDDRRALLELRTDWLDSCSIVSTVDELREEIAIVKIGGLQ